MLSPHPRPSPGGRREIRGTDGLSSTCAELGFGIISDRPDILRKVAGEMGVALPRATPVAP